MDEQQMQDNHPESLHLEDLEPGGISPTRRATSVSTSKNEFSIAPLSGTRRKSGHALVGSMKDDAAIASTSGGPKPADTVAISMTNLKEEDATSSRSLAMDSFTTAASTLSLEDFCKICHCGSEINMPLIAPCFCSGSLKFVHQDCLQRWIKSANIKRCELCKYPFTMQSKVKPFCQWEKLDMTSLERRKLFCSVTFHLIAITCVAWSLYVLIDRTAAEIRQGQLQWPFWTKLVVVAIGFTGGLVFMYIQCKVYVHLCAKWKAYNRIIVVQDAPEGIHKNKATEESRKSSLKDSSNVTSSLPHAVESPSASTSNARRTSSEPPPPAVSSATVNSAASSALSSAAPEKTHAETQTALRGVSIREVMRTTSDGGGCCAELLPVASVSKILEDISHDNATIFFTECEIEDKRVSSSGLLEPVCDFAGQERSKGEIKEPLLICDLPGRTSPAQAEKNADHVDSDAAAVERSDNE